MKEVLSFLKNLAANNNREWFAANKDTYRRIKSVSDLLAERFIAAIAEADPEAARLSVSDCTYRIYRDTRFSPDKTPYKTHIGIFVNPPAGKKSPTSGYYLHIEPGNSMIAAGNICHPAPILKAIRQSIFDNIDEYLAIVESADFKKYFPRVGENPLKTAPKGFPKDWKYLDYIRPRDFVTSMSLSDSQIISARLIDNLRPVIAQAKRLNNFLNFTIEDFIPSEKESQNSIWKI